ncbi:MAG: hypothetical protein AAGA68_14495 [Pseudomonadota bacterium]
MAKVLVSLAFGLAVLFTGSAEAYIGPGAGITAIGSLVALLGAVCLAIVGFVWYPLKRLRARMKGRAELAEADRQ